MAIRRRQNQRGPVVEDDVNDFEISNSYRYERRIYTHTHTHESSVEYIARDKCIMCQISYEIFLSDVLIELRLSLVISWKIRIYCFFNI